MLEVEMGNLYSILGPKFENNMLIMCVKQKKNIISLKLK